MTASLEQMHITYHPGQDRLLLRVNAGEAGEFRVWLTRRYAELLLGLLCDLMDKEGGMQRLASDENTLSQLKAGAMTQHRGEPPGPAGDSPLPLGAEGILGHRITYNREIQGKISLQLLPENGHGLNLNLNPSMLYMLYNMLEQGVTQADWRLHSTARLRGPVH